MPFHKCSFPFTHDNRIYKKCAMIPNPSADNHYCHQYFKQRQRNPKLVHSKPHKVTRLVLHNGTKVLCWEEGLGGAKNMSISTSGRYGWCKVLLVRIYTYRISANSFRTCMYCGQRSQYIRLNSKKNSFCGNYSQKYGI